MAGDVFNSVGVWSEGSEYEPMAWVSVYVEVLSEHFLYMATGLTLYISITLTSDALFFIYLHAVTSA
jgi:hypothetical protein